MIELERITRPLRQALEKAKEYGLDRITCSTELIENVLVFLEPLPVIETQSTIRCPSCNKQITSRGCFKRDINFCWKCGQALSWNTLMEIKYEP